MLRFFFKRKTDPAVDRLYEAAVAAARQPAFYQSYGVPDTLDGRFDMIVFHIAPVIDGLRDEAGAITPHGQALFDRFLFDMEQNLRTIGVGDMSVPKKMKKMGEAFYGRFDAYRQAGNRAALATAAARNVLGEAARAETPAALALADYYRTVADRAAAGDPVAAFAFPDAADFAPAVPAAVGTASPLDAAEKDVAAVAADGPAQADAPAAADTTAAAGAADAKAPEGRR